MRERSKGRRGFEGTAGRGDGAAIRRADQSAETWRP